MEGKIAQISRSKIPQNLLATSLHLDLQLSDLALVTDDLISLSLTYLFQPHCLGGVEFGLLTVHLNVCLELNDFLRAVGRLVPKHYILLLKLRDLIQVTKDSLLQGLVFLSHPGRLGDAKVGLLMLLLLCLRQGRKQSGMHESQAGPLGARCFFR